jgi:hypothetical protein
MKAEATILSPEKAVFLTSYDKLLYSSQMFKEGITPKLFVNVGHKVP